MSAFETTPLDIALRDCGINSFIIVGVATEIGIEPTIRHGDDLGYIPIVVTDACGAGHAELGDHEVHGRRDVDRHPGDPKSSQPDEAGLTSASTRTGYAQR